MWWLWLISALALSWILLGLLYLPLRCPHCGEVLVFGVYCSCTGGVEQYPHEEGGSFT